VVVVVCVAAAARPGTATNEELLKAKLLDVYTPAEREALHQAIMVVKESPELLDQALGIDHQVLGDEFFDRLSVVESVLSP
jgi:hypothetical protein